MRAHAMPFTPSLNNPFFVLKSVYKLFYPSQFVPTQTFITESNFLLPSVIRTLINSLLFLKLF